MEIEYINCEQIFSENIFFIENIAHFKKIVKESGGRVFVLDIKKNQKFPKGCFASPTPICVYAYPSNGFKTIEDLESASNIYFQNGSDFYKFIELGLKDLTEYEGFVKSGLSTKKEWTRFIRKGFEKSFEKLQSGDIVHVKKRNVKMAVNSDGSLSPFNSSSRQMGTNIREVIQVHIFGQHVIQSDKDVFYLNDKLGDFKNFNEMLDSISNNIQSKTEYDEYIKSGFESREDQISAKRQGFEISTDYYNATEIELKTYQLYQKYKSIESEAENKGYQYSEEILLDEILRKPHYAILNKALLISNISSEWITYLKNYYKQSFGINPPNLPKLIENEEIEKVILNNKYFCENFYYVRDQDAAFLRNFKKITTDQIVVDGSNVAWADGSSETGDKAKAKNIRLLLSELNNIYQIKDIVTIIDASLIHQVDDPEELEKLIKSKMVLKAPANSDADGFLLQVTKEKKALLITNDSFKDWKEKDPWIKEHIDFFRVPFMFLGDSVRFDSKLEELLK